MLENWCVSFFICAIVVLPLACWAGCDCGRFEQRSMAVKAGAGRWTVDPNTGKTQFEYLSPDKEKQ